MVHRPRYASPSLEVCSRETDEVMIQLAFSNRIRSVYIDLNQEMCPLTYGNNDIGKAIFQVSFPGEEQDSIVQDGQVILLPFKEDSLEEVSKTEIGIILTLLLILRQK
jgi:hypothetical protein